MFELPFDISREAYQSANGNHREKIEQVFKALHIAGKVIDFHISKPCFSAAVQFDIEIRTLLAKPAHEFVKFN